MPEKFESAVKTSATEAAKIESPNARETTKFLEKLDPQTREDYINLKNRKEEYESHLNDIAKMDTILRNSAFLEEKSALRQSIQEEWVPPARKALTEWIDAEGEFAKKYGADLRKRIESKEREETETKSYQGKTKEEIEKIHKEEAREKWAKDAMEIVYEITEYSPEERQLAKEGKPILNNQPS